MSDETNIAELFDAGMNGEDIAALPQTIEPETKQEVELDEVAELRKQLDESNRLFKEADNERRAFKGRVPAMQSQLDKLLKDRSAPAQPQTVQKADTQERATLAKRLESLPNWARHAREYPEEGQALFEAIEAVENAGASQYSSLREKTELLEKRLAEITERDLPQRLKPLEDWRAEQVNAAWAKEQQEEISRVTDAHPDWKDHIKLVAIDDGGGNETVEIAACSQAMSDWLESQPEEVADMFASDDPKTCIWVMNQFKNHLGGGTHQAEQNGQSQSTRQNNLAKRAAAVGNGSGVARASGQSLDVATAFDLQMERLNN